MATDLIDIRGKINTMLSGISQLNGVYLYEPDKPESGKYPFATITYEGGDGQFGDTIRNIRRHRFNINIYQERTQAGFGNSKAETIILTILDAIYTLFDGNTTLDGMVKWVKVLSTDGGYVEREAGDTRVARVLVEATTVVPSTS